MTYTRTFTLEEYALSALCDGRAVRLHCSDVEGNDVTGVVGKIKAIRAGTTPTERVITVEEADQRHEVVLDYGVVEYL